MKLSEDRAASEKPRHDAGGDGGALRRHPAVHFQMGGGYCAAGNGKAADAFRNLRYVAGYAAAGRADAGRGAGKPSMRPKCRKKRCTRAFSSKKARRAMPRTTGLRISRRGIGSISSFTERCSLIQSETKRRRCASARLAGRWAYRMSRCTGKSENRNLSFLIALRRAGKCAILAMR